jgi:tetratricopeptide (TPR) repeat protein
MAHIFVLNLEMLGTVSDNQSPRIQNLLKNAENSIKPDSTPWELRHLEAARLWAKKGDLQSALQIWNKILEDYPSDLIALKLAYYAYYFLGEPEEMAAHMEKSASHFRDLAKTKKIPLTYDQPHMTLGFVLGMYAFTLEEIHHFQEAEKIGREALKINPRDTWAVHAVNHVMEMEGRQKEGIQFLTSTVQDWKHSRVLCCHNFWHLCLHYIELGKFDHALEIFDKEMLPRYNEASILDLVDGSSLLYRIELEGKSVGIHRWQPLVDAFRPHRNRVLLFNDAHFMMANRHFPKESSDLIRSLKDYVGNSTLYQCTNRKISCDIGLPLLEGLRCVNEKRYNDAVHLLYPLLRDHKLIKIGGSEAQRDIFNVTLIHAMIMSQNPNYKNLLYDMLEDRMMCKKYGSPLTSRWIERAKQVFDDKPAPSYVPKSMQGMIFTQKSRPQGARIL